MGELANILVGSVTLTPLPAGAVVRPPYRTYDNVPFYVVRGKQGIYAFSSRAFFDERCLIQYDSVADRLRCAVPGRSYEWTRFGRYLGPATSVRGRTLPVKRPDVGVLGLGRHPTRRGRRLLLESCDRARPKRTRRRAGGVGDAAHDPIQEAHRRASSA